MGKANGSDCAKGRENQTKIKDLERWLAKVDDRVIEQADRLNQIPWILLSVLLTLVISLVGLVLAVKNGS